MPNSRQTHIEVSHIALMLPRTNLFPVARYFFQNSRNQPIRDGRANMAQVAQETRIPLVSACPICGHEQAQWYSHLALSTRLRRGHPIEGYCVICQEWWQLDSHERSDLAAKLAS